MADCGFEKRGCYNGWSHYCYLPRGQVNSSHLCVTCRNSF